MSVAVHSPLNDFKHCHACFQFYRGCMKGVATLTSHRSSQLFNADDPVLLVLLFAVKHREYDSNKKNIQHTHTVSQDPCHVS